MSSKLPINSVFLHHECASRSEDVSCDVTGSNLLGFRIAARPKFALCSVSEHCVHSSSVLVTQLRPTLREASTRIKATKRGTFQSRLVCPRCQEPQALPANGALDPHVFTRAHGATRNCGCGTPSAEYPKPQMNCCALCDASSLPLPKRASSSTSICPLHRQN